MLLFFFLLYARVGLVLSSRRQSNGVSESVACVFVSRRIVLHHRASLRFSLVLFFLLKRQHRMYFLTLVFLFLILFVTGIS